MRTDRQQPGPYQKGPGSQSGTSAAPFQLEVLEQPDGPKIALCSLWLNKSVWLIVSFFLVLRTDIASEFKEQLQTLILHVLNPANLMEKEINGSKVTCRGLLEYFKVNMGFSLLKYLTFGETDIRYELTQFRYFIFFYFYFFNFILFLNFT